MRTLTLKLCVTALALLALAFLPSASRADTLTLNGTAIDSFADNPSLKTLSVQMDTGDALVYKTDVTDGNEITDLFLEEFALVDGVNTLVNEFDFRDDFAKSFQFVTGTDMLSVDVTFVYGEVKAVDISGQGTGNGGGNGDDNGNGNGNTVPEPSSVALFASGLLGLAVLGRKRLTN